MVTQTRRIFYQMEFYKPLILLLRTYIRFAPFSAGKRWLWSRVMDPYVIWNSHQFVAATVFGVKIKGDAKEILQQYVYYFGAWEPLITHWISRCLKHGDTFVDVGANIGYYSLLASKLVGEGGAVVAIEASPKTFEKLQANLALNGVSNVRPVNLAAADSERTVKLFRGHDHHIGLATILDDSGFDLECEVETAPLSKILRLNEIERARIIKIDVEGAEFLVVSGMEPILKGDRPDLEIIIEVDPKRLMKQGTTTEELLRPFAEAIAGSRWCVAPLTSGLDVFSHHDL